MTDAGDRTRAIARLRPSILAIALAASALAASPVTAEGGPDPRHAAGRDAAWIPFVLPWDDASPGPADVSFLLDPPAGRRGFIEARDGHFRAGGRRIRFFGVNVCFGACFPPPGDAARIAARLAKFGVNCVRFHHMDASPFPRGIFADARRERLSAEALDRLDRFIAELARRGIYADLNLHVSRWWSRAHGWPHAETLAHYDKMLDIVHPDLIEAQKRYARDLLTHRNPYTKRRHVEDPAIAIVEITNEDSLFMWSAARFLPHLPDPYAALFAGKWNGWLRRRYGADADLRAAWAAGGEPLGGNLLAGPAFAPLGGAAGSGPWRIEQHEGAAARVRVRDAEGGRVARVEMERTTGVSWHVQLKYAGIGLRKGAFYTVRFRARADRTKRAAVGVSQDHAPWANLGLSRSLALETAWRPFAFGFTCRSDEPDARLSFSLGTDGTAVEISRVELRPGGRIGLADGESLQDGNVALFPDLFSITQARIDDRLRFLHDLERDYFTGMRDYLKRDLGLRALVTGTIAFGSLGTRVQARMDFVDQHAYWQHPRFPHRPWDPRDWLIRNRAMSADPRGGTFPRLAATRVAGKPYTVTEYNHPAPLDAQAEAVPMIATFAAWQDWDGVFLFTYSHASEARRDRIHGFFDIDGNPSKMGFLPAGALIFSGGRLAPAPRSVERRIGAEEAIEAARASVTHLTAYLETAGFAWRLLLRRRFAIAFDGTGNRREGSDRASGPAGSRGSDRDPTRLAWRTGEGGRYTVDGPSAKVLCGRLGGETIVLGAVTVRVAAPARASIAIVSRDPAPIGEARQVLLVACGRCENTGMGWNADRTSVADRWGASPVRIEVVRATIAIRSKAGHLGVRALDPRGRPAGEIPVEATSEGFRFAIGRGAASLWYVVEASD